MPKRKAANQGGRGAKRARKQRVARPVASRTLVYPVKRRLETVTQFTSSGSASVYTSYGAKSFTLSDLPGYSELVALFGQWRMLKVDLQCIPRVNSNTTANPSYLSNFTYAFDYTMATAPTAIGQILQYDSCKTVNAQDVREFHITIKPRTSDVFYNGSVVSGYGANAAGTWINTTSPSVPHYGLLWAWENNQTTINAIDVYSTYWCEFKMTL